MNKNIVKSGCGSKKLITWIMGKCEILEPVKRDDVLNHLA